jgi:hypothetical protein
LRLQFDSAQKVNNKKVVILQNFAILTGWGRAVSGGDSSPTLKLTNVVIDEYRYVCIEQDRTHNVDI